MTNSALNHLDSTTDKQNIARDRFIPFRKQSIIELCTASDRLAAEHKLSFVELSQILQSLFHFEFHGLLETLKNCYAPFNPHADTLITKPLSESALNQAQQQFASTFKQVLNAANFERITEQDLRDALNEESLFKVRLAVDFDDFEHVVFYRRGEYRKTTLLSQFFGLKQQSFSYTNYDRVAVYIQFKPAAHFKNRTINFKPGSTIIKLFQDVPKADLEMLFPNSEVRMRNIDKLILGGSAIIGGSFVLITKLGASLLLLASLFSFWLGFHHQEVTITQQQLMGLGAGLGIFGGFIFREWNKFKNRKISFMKALADNLYFKNLDNNAGVFHHLIDIAEEEEVKEAILAYYFLLTSPTPLTEQALDQAIEQWFVDEHQVVLDFEVDDALNKLTRLGLVNEDNGHYTALSLQAAKVSLDRRWDNLFGFQNEH